MKTPTFRRHYGKNPYVGYDSAARPFLYSGENPPHGIHPLMRVVRVGERAWPMSRLEEAGELREAGVLISWMAGKASALTAPHWRRDGMWGRFGCATPLVWILCMM